MLQDLISFILILAGFYIVGHLTRFLLGKYLIRLVKQNAIVTSILRGVTPAILLAFLITGFSVAFPYLPFVSPQIVRYVQVTCQVALILIATWIAVRIFGRILAFYSKERLAGLTPIFAKIGNLLIYIIALILILDSLGVDVTALVAGLGIAGIAVAFALQETLANFFAGVYIMTDRPIRIGDFIELENGQKGYVIDIGWRSTKIRELPNNVIVIPNSKLVGSILKNYYLPKKEMAVLVQVGVSYDSDLEKVEKVTIDVAKEVMKKVVGEIDFEPFIRYHTFGDFSINFTVILRVKEYVDQYLLVHEFIKALHRRYKEEGIEIPFPIQTVYLRGKTSA